MTPHSHLSQKTTLHMCLRVGELMKRRNICFRFSGVLRSVGWYFVGVSGERVGPIFRGERNLRHRLLDLCPETSVTANQRCVKS